MHTNRRGINWISEKTYFWLLNIDTCTKKPMNVIPCYSCAFTWLYFTIKVYDRHLSIECHPVHRAMFGLIMRCWPSFLLSCPTELDYIHICSLQIKWKAQNLRLNEEIKLNILNCSKVDYWFITYTLFSWKEMEVLVYSQITQFSNLKDLQQKHKNVMQTNNQYIGKKLLETEKKFTVFLK